MTQRSTDAAQMSKGSWGTTAAVSSRDNSLHDLLSVFISAFAAELCTSSKSRTQARKKTHLLISNQDPREMSAHKHTSSDISKQKISCKQKCFYHLGVKNISAIAQLHKLDHFLWLIKSFL